MPALRRWRDIVHGRQKPVGGADVGEPWMSSSLDRVSRQSATPAPVLPGQPFGRVAQLQVVRIEVHGRPRTDRERHVTVGQGAVVGCRDLHRAGFRRAVDHPHEPLPPQRVRRRREQRHHMNFIFVFRHSRDRRQIRQVAGRTRQQAHRHDGLIRSYLKPPLAGAVAERAVNARPRFQVGCPQRQRLAGGDLQLDGCTRRGAGVVDARNRHLGRRVAPG